MIQPTILVRAEWDPEAGVFVAASDDVPGLVAEAATPDALREKLEVLIPELLALNEPGNGNKRLQEVRLVITSQQITQVRLYA